MPRDRTGRNPDGPPRADALAERTRSPCLSVAFPANREPYCTSRGFFAGDTEITECQRSNEHSRVIIGIDSTQLPPPAVSPNARRARCCGREPCPIDILSPVPTRAAASFPRLAYPRTPCLSANVRETIARILSHEAGNFPDVRSIKCCVALRQTNLWNVRNIGK